MQFCHDSGFVYFMLVDSFFFCHDSRIFFFVIIHSFFIFMIIDSFFHDSKFVLFMILDYVFIQNIRNIFFAIRPIYDIQRQKFRFGPYPNPTALDNAFYNIY